MKKNGNPVWGADGLPQTEPGHDGWPDENGKWNSYDANAEDPRCRQRLKRSMDLLSRLGVSDFFFDTVDTASPWGPYPWMAPGMKSLLEELRAHHPRSEIFVNRGFFLFEKDPETMVSPVDGVMVESSHSSWDWHRSQGQPSLWYEDHRRILEEVLLPLQRRREMEVLLLNYFDPHQEDDRVYLHLLGRDALGKGISHATSDPLLHRFHPPLILEPESSTPWLEATLVEEEGHRRVILPDNRWWTLLPKQSPEPWSRGYVPRRDLLMKNALRVPLDWEGTMALLALDEQGRVQERRRLTGVEARAPSFRGEISARDGGFFVGCDGAWSVEVVDVAGEEQLVSGEGPRGVLDWPNGSPLWVRARERRHEGWSAHSPWQSITPIDTTPPPAPKIENLTFSHYLEIAWSKAEGEAASSFEIFMEHEDHGLGLPLQVSGQRTRYRMDLRHLSRIRIHLVALDANNNPSPRVSTPWLSREP